MFKIPNFLTILIPALLFSGVASAQTLIVENNSQISAEISAKELTRISVAGDRITLVRGSEGAYQISNDPVQGAIFIRPIIVQPIVHKMCPVLRDKDKKQCPKIKNHVNHLRTFYLFISTEQGRHYVFHLTPLYSKPADIIVLKPEELEQKAAKTWETSEDYPQTLVHLLNAILQQKTPPGYIHNVFKKPKEFTFGQHCNLKLTEQYTGAHLSVNVYQLTNHSRQSETLAEKDLYQSGDRAIYLQEHNLAPRQTIQLIKVISHV